MTGENIDVNVIDQIFGKEEEQTVETPEVPTEAKAEEPTPESKPQEEAEIQTTESNAEKTLRQTPDTNKVDYGALKAERMRRKELEKKLAELEAKLAAPQTPAQPPANATAEEKSLWETNKEEALRQAILIQQEQFERLQQSLQERQQQEEAARQVTELAEAYKQSGLEYAQTNPEYQEAYKYITAIKADELKLMGYQGEQLKEQLLSWELKLAYDAYQAEMNPHEVFHELARAYRFQPSQPAPQQQNAVAGKLATIKQGLQDNKVLPNSKGEVLTNEDESGTRIEDMLFSVQRKKAK